MNGQRSTLSSSLYIGSAVLEPFARSHRWKRTQDALSSVASVSDESATAEEHPAGVEARTVQRWVVAGGRHGLPESSPMTQASPFLVATKNVYHA